MLAAGVLPLATAYSISEAFGFRKGVSLDFRRAPMFVGTFTVLVFPATAVALVPNLPMIQLLVGIQTLNAAQRTAVERARLASVALVGGAATILVVTRVADLFIFK